MLLVGELSFFGCEVGPRRFGRLDAPRLAQPLTETRKHPRE